MLTPALDPLFIAYNTGAGGRNPAYNLDCTQVFHARNSFKSRFWQFSGEKLL